MTPWLLRLRKVPLLGWLVAIIAVLIALLIWSVKAASYRERRLRVSMEISSAKKDHESVLSKIEEGNKLARSEVMALQAAELGKLEGKRSGIATAEKEGTEALATMVNEMFRR